jgi:hypothetical protein
LKKLDYLNRSQLQRLHRLGKVRNANRILSELSPYLSSFRDGYETIYFLNKEGREYTGAKKILRKTQFVNHVILRNEFYLFVKCPVEWKAEMKGTDGVDKVICDAWFKSNQRYNFLEVDSKQKMSENIVKAQSYLNMFKRGGLHEHFGYFPTLIWLTVSDHRKKRLMEICKELPCKVYTVSEIK